ncbi:MAG: hypothetical protein LBV79_09195 [Candidatus Adiutrix sp.]|nr:hypothetical protein [Candidatus Adiutrix sp.]
MTNTVNGLFIRLKFNSHLAVRSIVSFQLFESIHYLWHLDIVSIGRLQVAGYFIKACTHSLSIFKGRIPGRFAAVNHVRPHLEAFHGRVELDFRGLLQKGQQVFVQVEGAFLHGAHEDKNGRDQDDEYHVGQHESQHYFSSEFHIWLL